MKFRLVSCTQKTKEQFLKQQFPLAESFQKHLKCGNFYADDNALDYVFFENREGLPVKYNYAIQNAHKDDILVFCHDDVYINDIRFPEKIIESFNYFDVLGLAGTSKWSMKKPVVWHMCDQKDMSGTVLHKHEGKEWITFFGEYFKKCIFLDGLFLVARASTLQENNVLFDDRFKFHHYDLDFCLTAKMKRLKLGTCSIVVTHSSIGDWQKDPTFSVSEEKFISKWTNAKL
jgi:hypothetical protein